MWKCKARGQTEDEGLHSRIRRVLGHQTHRPCPGSPYSKEAPHADIGLETENGNVKGMSSSEHEHKMYNSKTPLRESSKVINDQDRKALPVPCHLLLVEACASKGSSYGHFLPFLLCVCVCVASIFLSLSEL